MAIILVIMCGYCGDVKSSAKQTNVLNDRYVTARPIPHSTRPLQKSANLDVFNRDKK